ncbi:MAG: discoidin domain-containing protein [Pirellulales bacterium]|nr:discoidin domain-containing protein [Pirellulales bacterium]
MDTAHSRLLIASIGCLVCLRALAAEDGAAGRPRADNVALGKTVLFPTPPNYPATTDPEDAGQLVDGKFASATPMWFDKSAVGWVLVDPTVLTIDLGAVQPIRGVGLHMGAGQAGVEWPSSIEIYVSDTGEQYSHAGNLMELLATPRPDSGYASFWLVAGKLETHGRYVKFVCSPSNLGNGAYIMLDEVEVYRGEAAWLSRPLAKPEAPERWRADWRELAWRDHSAAVPYAERPTRLLVVDGDATSGGDVPLERVDRDEVGTTFRLHGEAGKPRSMFWSARLPKPISTARCRYALLSYRAEGIRRTFERRPLVLLRGASDKAGGGHVPLLEANMALNDGRSHTLVKLLPEGFTLQQLKVAVFTEDDAPHLTLERLELLGSMPEVFSPEVATRAGPPREGLLPVDLGEVLDGSLAAWCDEVMGKHGIVFDGARDLRAGRVEVSGVPFRIGAPSRNLARMPESPEKNERVEFLGHMVDSRNLGPISRDDALSIKVDVGAREAFLLLALAAPPVQPRGGLPYTALRLDDIECLSVELAYESGPSETAFPYSLADRGCYIPCRELGAYAVAVDPARRLKEITLHSRQFNLGFALAALTLNTGNRPLVPQLATLPAPGAAARHPEPAARPIAIAVHDQRLSIGNRWYEYRFDLSQGFALDCLVNRTHSAAAVALAPSSGLRVRVGNTIYTGRCFKAEVVRMTATSAELKLASTRPELPLEIAVALTAKDSPELRFVVQARNTGKEPLAAELCLPALDGFSIGDNEQTRLFFPQYRTVDTAERVALRAPYGPEFAGQFMDVYSRAAGIGLMVRTDNREQRMAEFALRKDAAGVSGGVWFPAEFNLLAPGGVRAYPPVSLFAHGGDWHTALQLYRDWVRSWYKPCKSQDEAWFLKAWDLQCYRVSDKLSWLEARVPPPISADRKRFFVDETFEFEKQRLGHVPDLVHFFHWTYNDQKNRDEYGVFGSPRAYEQVGGLEFFRQGIDRMQTKWQRPVSLYTLPDRFRASALPDQALSRDLAGAAAHKSLDGDASAALRGVGPSDGIFFPPFGDERWTAYIVDDIARMQRDTGCRIVYMDVFPRFSHLRGVPGISPREDDLNVIQRVREALPDDVALWTEYPLTDVASQYADGCLQYYFLELNQTFARRYNMSDRAADLFAEMPLNVGRFVLGKYRTFCLPGYIEASNKPGQVDAVFVNGEPFHEDTFRLQYSRLRARINRSYVLKHEYADCFGGDDPAPWVETAAAGITANLFPGKQRNLWTVFNGRPKTYAGVVLIVADQPGAKYRDAWNGQPLEPVVSSGMAHISLTLDPQQPGCVVQERQR